MFTLFSASPHYIISPKNQTHIIQFLHLILTEHFVIVSMNASVSITEWIQHVSLSCQYRKQNIKQQEQDKELINYQDMKNVNRQYSLNGSNRFDFIETCSVLLIPDNNGIKSRARIKLLLLCGFDLFDDINNWQHWYTVKNWYEVFIPLWFYTLQFLSAMQWTIPRLFNS